MNKLRDFQSFIYSSSFNVIAIVETWLSPFITDNEILPTGYSIYRKDRKSRGGGVLLAIYHSLPSLQLQSPPDLEVATVQIGAKGNVAICVVYIPPNADNSYHSKLLDYLGSTLDKHQTLIMGDFNSPDICWTTFSSQSTSSRAICNLAFRHDLTQLVDFPTHISGNTLDIIFSPPTITVTDLQSISCPLLRSDHLILSFSYSISNLYTKCSSSRTILDYTEEQTLTICRLY